MNVTDSPKSQRYCMRLSYQGTDFSGWASQPGLPTVQGALEKALSQLLAHPVQVVCAGRTDRGVHATAQHVHFDTAVQRSEDNWLRGTAAYLPRSIVVDGIWQVSDGFNARYSALSRSYCYVIYTGQRMAPGMRTWMHHERRPLDVQAMQLASDLLLGEHDFSAFRGAGCQSQSSKRCMMALRCHAQGDMLCIAVQANAFLLHMVRNIVGSLLVVGRGEKQPAWMGKVLASQNRRQAGVTAPPQGLYLVGVTYPNVQGLGGDNFKPWFLN